VGVVSVEQLATEMERRERRWTWEYLDPVIKAKFVAQMNERLPKLDHRAEWQGMTVKGRQELSWHLSRSPEQLRSAWEEDCERIRLAADEATCEAFSVLSRLRSSGAA
jgi:hypothetical protein